MVSAEVSAALNRHPAALPLFPSAASAVRYAASSLNCLKLGEPVRSAMRVKLVLAPVPVNHRILQPHHHHVPAAAGKAVRHTQAVRHSETAVLKNIAFLFTLLSFQCQPDQPQISRCPG